MPQPCSSSTERRKRRWKGPKGKQNTASPFALAPEDDHRSWRDPAPHPEDEERAQDGAQDGVHQDERRRREEGMLADDRPLGRRILDDLARGVRSPDHPLVGTYGTAM